MGLNSGIKMRLRQGVRLLRQHHVIQTTHADFSYVNIRFSRDSLSHATLRVHVTPSSSGWRLRPPMRAVTRPPSEARAQPVQSQRESERPRTDTSSLAHHSTTPHHHPLLKMASIARNVLRRGYATASSVKVCNRQRKREQYPAPARPPARHRFQRLGWSFGRKLLPDLGTVDGDEQRMHGRDVDASALGRHAARLHVAFRARGRRWTEDWK